MVSAVFQVQNDFFGSEEMLLHKPEASEITFSSLPQKVLLHSPQCHTSVLLYDTITEQDL